jgi:hypothetical protein
MAQLFLDISDGWLCGLHNFASPRRKLENRPLMIFKAQTTKTLVSSVSNTLPLESRPCHLQLSII